LYKKSEVINGFLSFILAFAILMIYVYVEKARHDKLIRYGRPVVMIIKSVAPVNSDGKIMQLLFISQRLKERILKVRKNRCLLCISIPT
jgi:hypothetical protein